MQADLWERSRAIMSMLRSEIERRSQDAAAGQAEIVRAVLKELTPPGWRYRLYPAPASEAPDFLLIPAAFAG